MRLRGMLSQRLLASGLAALLLGPAALTAGSAAASGASPAAGVEVAGAAASAGSAASISPVVLSAWRGGIDLYRPGVFTTQGTWLWCTAADIQITRNIVFHLTDHSTASQRAYFNWMRLHNHYRLPLSGGVDAQGWTAGFRQFVDSRYRLYASTSFDSALRSAVTNLRRTNLPVGLTVDHGNHAWLITGFTATADPARTSAFTVTSVRVVGPLYGLQSRNGYDMPPDTRLTPSQLRRFFTPWYYAPLRMVWDGRYVSIQPVAVATAATAPVVPSPMPLRSTSTPVSATPSVGSAPASGAPSATDAPFSAGPAAAETESPQAALLVRGAATPAPLAPAGGPGAGAGLGVQGVASSAGPMSGAGLAVALLGMVVLAAGAVAGLRHRRLARS